jgi:hypothetical protein
MDVATKRATVECLNALHLNRAGLYTSKRGDNEEEFDRAGNEARVKSEHARLALEEHIAEHQC